MPLRHKTDHCANGLTKLPLLTAGRNVWITKMLTGEIAPLNCQQMDINRVLKDLSSNG
jgi:hypothetical protein